MFVNILFICEVYFLKYYWIVNRFINNFENCFYIKVRFIFIDRKWDWDGRDGKFINYMNLFIYI